MKDFEFEKVSKDVPYDVPVDFFKKSSDKILGQISSFERKRARRRIGLVVYYAAAVLTVGIFLGIAIYPHRSNQRIEYVLKHISNSDLQKLENTVTSDPFY
jgi:hypothetical protein